MKRLIFLLLIICLVSSAYAVEVKVKEEISGVVYSYYLSGTEACVGKGACTTVKIVDHATGQLGYIDCNTYVPSYLYARANCGTGYNSYIREGNLMQNIYYNDGTSACSGKWSRPCSSINYGTNGNIPYNSNTGCGWYFGSNFVTAVCEYSCTGGAPSNSQLCTGDNAGLSANTPITLVSICGAPKCEYICNTGYVKSGSECIQQTYNCGGSAPTTTTGTTKGPSTYSPSTYIPSSWTYSADATTATPCKWRCNTGYGQSGTQCKKIDGQSCISDSNCLSNYCGISSSDQTKICCTSTPEICDGKDNNCDGIIDENVNCGAGKTCTSGQCVSTCTKITYYYDSDNDGYGVENTNYTKQLLCSATGFYRSTNKNDCDDANALIKPGATEICADSIDNNCNGESDYDSADGRHGDVSCAVGVTANPIVSNANPFENTYIGVSCTSTDANGNPLANLNSISASLGGSLCSYNSWNGNSVSFGCNTGSTNNNQITIKEVKCKVDTSKSYAVSGQEESKVNINVNPTPCSSYTSSSTCPATCDWCAQCSGVYSTKQADACVTKGTCLTRVCWKGQCGAACDGTLGGCTGSTCNTACQCSAVNGVCGTGHYNCAAGTSISNVDGTAQYTWTCQGVNGGTSMNCAESKCKTSGDCTGTLCANYYCSSGHICQNQWKWNGVECVQASLCGNTCPYLPSQTQYWQTPACWLGSPASSSCCSVTYGTPTTDWGNVVPF